MNVNAVEEHIVCVRPRSDFCSASFQDNFIEFYVSRVMDGWRFACVDSFSNDRLYPMATVPLTMTTEPLTMATVTRC